MAEKDYYTTLDVDPSASKDEIRRAYRKLAMKYHPDHNVGDPEAERQFQAITEAYNAITDHSSKYYGILGVTKGADVSDIKRAYYRICEINHPGKRAGDPEAIKRLEVAKKAFDFLVGQQEEIEPNSDDGW